MRAAPYVLVLLIYFASLVFIYHHYHPMPVSDNKSNVDIQKLLTKLYEPSESEVKYFADKYRLPEKTVHDMLREYDLRKENPAASARP